MLEIAHSAGDLLCCPARNVGGFRHNMQVPTLRHSTELHDPANAQWSEILNAINEPFAGTSLTERDLIVQLDNVVRTTKNNAAPVGAAQNNNDDFYQDLEVIKEFPSAVLLGHEASAEFTDTLLKNQDHSSPVKILQRLGFQEYRAGKRGIAK